MKKNHFLQLIFFVISINSFSQGNFQLHLGTAIPISDFANKELSDDYAGGAAPGVNLGVQYLAPLSRSRDLFFFAGFDLNFNGLKKESKKDIEDAFNLLNADIKHSKYYNIPLSAGVLFKHYMRNHMAIYAQGGLTINIFKYTNFVATINNEEYIVKYDIDNSVGFRIGGGLDLNDNISLGVDYFALGKHHADGQIDVPLFGPVDTSIETKVDILTITLGYRF
jgi:opacity protein-like surface antigen